eukprot:Transcript_12962.p1 GENE.Transcript_12962~~Transcript_12962.p1  ORF type:complete len:151 (+),score=29.15 Transcript_12962:22-453(+)
MNEFMNLSPQVQLRAQEWKYASPKGGGRRPPTTTQAEAATTGQRAEPPEPAESDTAVAAVSSPEIDAAESARDGQKAAEEPVPVAAPAPAPAPAPRRVIPGSDWRETVSSSSMNEFMNPSQQVQLHAQKWKYAKHDAKKDEAP